MQHGKVSLFRFDMASSTTVNATPKQVWDAFQDPSRWPQWSHVCTRVWDISPDLWAIGSRLSFRLRMTGVAVPFSVRVTESQPPYCIAWASTAFTITAVRTFTFQPQGNATLVTDHKRFSSPMLPISMFYPRWLIRNVTQAWLHDLKVEAERMALTNRTPPV